MLLNILEFGSFVIEVEVTPYCNFNCNFCENKNQHTFEYYNNYNINFNELTNFIFKIVKKYSNITIILNGGEPTLHPNLPDFISAINDINVILYTNLSQTIDYYQKLQKNNIKIIPTFHLNEINIDEFTHKLTILNINTIVLPVSDDFLNNLDIMTKFDKFNINLNLLENKTYTTQQISFLACYDKNILKQYKILLQKTNTKVCTSTKHYLYVNGDGNIYRCMFNHTLQPLGNIQSFSVDKIEQNPFVCNNNFCFYTFT